MLRYMARQSKIEKYGCEEIVKNGIREAKSLREIAEECSTWAEVEISHTAVSRFIESMQKEEQKTKKEVIKQDQRRVVKVVNQEFDIIQTQLKTTQRLLERFEYIDNIPEYFDEKIDELIHTLVEKSEDVKVIAYLESWQATFEGELKRKVYEITALNRELRENSKFLADLREKAYEFSLIQEYLAVFMDIFEKASPQAYENTIQKIAANPRLQKIVDQQNQLRGE